MEDTKSLLIMVLHKIFHDRPKMVEDTYQLIYNFNSGKRESAEYEKTLKTICELMNDELPSEILVYLLTLVDMPQENENQPPVIEKIQKTYNCLSKSVRPALLDYLSNNKSRKEDCADETNIHIDISPINEQKIPEIPQNDATSFPNKKVSKKINARSRQKKLKSNSSKSYSTEENENVTSLLDLTAFYVIKHQQRLTSLYKSKLGQAWKLINSNSIKEDDLKKCYTAVEDLNKKTKLLRCIENDKLTDDLFLTESSMFIKKQIFEKDPFDAPQDILDTLKNLLE